MSQSRYCHGRHTHTHIHTSKRTEVTLRHISEGSREGGEGGGIVAGAEEDAVPLHVNTVQLDHKLTGL